jgi:uncharacterized protein with FMN-binding domain
MRRVTLWLLSTITILVLLLSYRTSLSPATSTIAVGAVGAQSAANGPTSSAEPPPERSSAPKKSPHADPSSTHPARVARTYAGSVVDTNYGPVQVQVTVLAGRITKSVAAQVPWSGRRDQEINAQAVPILNAEAVRAQGAGIDMVSGATYTSTGYIQSLQAALDRAHL